MLLIGEGEGKMNEYWLYFLFTLSNIPLYFILYQLIKDRQFLQHETVCLYEQLLKERSERRYSDMEEGNSEEEMDEQEEGEEGEGEEGEEDRERDGSSAGKKHEKSD